MCHISCRENYFLSRSAVSGFLKQAFKPFALCLLCIHIVYFNEVKFKSEYPRNQYASQACWNKQEKTRCAMLMLELLLFFFSEKVTEDPKVGRRTPALFSQLMAPFGICRKHVSRSIRLVYSYAGTGGCPLASFTVPQVFQGSPSVPVCWLYHMAHSPGPDLLHSSTSHAPRLH